MLQLTQKFMLPTLVLAGILAGGAAITHRTNQGVSISPEHNPCPDCFEQPGQRTHWETPSYARQTASLNSLSSTEMLVSVDPITDPPPSQPGKRQK